MIKRVEQRNELETLEKRFLQVMPNKQSSDIFFAFTLSSPLWLEGAEDNYQLSNEYSSNLHDICHREAEKKQGR